MRVALVTTWQTACGIAEHSAYLKKAVEAADPTIEITLVTDLHPQGVEHIPGVDLIWLNYQAALHSQWTPDAIRTQRERGIPAGVTYHDTGVPNSDQCKGITAAAAATVVHEPCDDLPGRVEYWRMGVPDWCRAFTFDQDKAGWCGQRPILGTIGFPFPWKNYDELARVTAANGWALMLIAPTASLQDIARWQTLNPHLWVEQRFLLRDLALAQLAGCDATAFCYTCANTGQSAAILQGIAARKPVIAFTTCRQFRSLYLDPLGQEVIEWATSFEDVGRLLRHLPLGERRSPGIVALAEQESWEGLGRKYAALFRELGGRKD